MMMKENLKNHLRDLNSNMTQVIDTNKYIEFVRQTTSPASSDFAALLARMTELEAEGVELTHLLTFALGASAELGEAVEIIKKCLLQGKTFNDDAKVHLLKECSDCFWYFAQLCIAMDTTFEEIMQINYEKLSARYPEGTFSVHRSENRKDGDI
jgi:intracellular sulfur oxidation DsrE/DsrF family protein